jgi:hypothetical protein
MRDSKKPRFFRGRHRQFFKGFFRTAASRAFGESIRRSLTTAASDRSSGRRLVWASRHMPTCCAMPAATSSPTMATTRGRSRPTSATAISRTPPATPPWRSSGSGSPFVIDRGRPPHVAQIDAPIFSSSEACSIRAARAGCYAATCRFPFSFAARSTNFSRSARGTCL